MPAIALVAGGCVVLLLTFVVARRTRRPEPLPETSDDPWAALAPRDHDEAARERHLRLWPIAASLAGLILIAGGLVNARGLRAPPQRTAPPFFIEVGDSPAPGESASPEPLESPESSAEAAQASASPKGSARPSASPTARPPSPTPTSRPTPTPTPTPPPKPGPVVGASTSCFGGQGSASISYSLTARDGTTLSSAVLLLDGRTVQTPNVSGRTSFNGSHTENVSSGQHTYRIRATGSDGGVTDRTFQVCI